MSATTICLWRQFILLMCWVRPYNFQSLSVWHCLVSTRSLTENGEIKPKMLLRAATLDKKIAFILPNEMMKCWRIQHHFTFKKKNLLDWSKFYPNIPVLSNLSSPNKCVRALQLFSPYQFGSNSFFFLLSICEFGLRRSAQQNLARFVGRKVNLKCYFLY